MFRYYIKKTNIVSLQTNMDFHYKTFVISTSRGTPRKCSAVPQGTAEPRLGITGLGPSVRWLQHIGITPLSKQYLKVSSLLPYSQIKGP